MSINFECPKSPVYHTSVQQKMMSKNAAHRYKYGSPKLRDLLREKCRIRVKEARRASFEGTRPLPGQSLIAKILREELAELEFDIKMQDLIYSELMEESNLWSVEEVENEENYLIDVTESEVIFCPVCQKSNLKIGDQTLFCDCGISFAYSGGPNKFQKDVQAVLEEHEKRCAETVNFFVEPNDLKGSVLNVLCSNCNCFYTFV